MRALDVLFARPLIDAKTLSRELDVSFNTGNKILDTCEGHIVEEINGGRRNRVFRHTPYLDLFAQPVGPAAGDDAYETTEMR